MRQNQPNSQTGHFEQLESNGMKVEDASPAFLKKLKEIGASMQADWLKSVGADGQAIIDEYNKM